MQTFRVVRAVAQALPLCGALLVLDVHPLRAQYLRAAPIQRASVANRTLHLTSEKRRPAARTYVLYGALVGVVAFGVGLEMWVENMSASDECLCSPLGFAPAFAGAAVIGGAAGYVVYRIRYR
ncbi:MAG TPA: hypothetical protein VJ867_10550 [Gemmatimonadaceae bacterium]|nr:hypothetical protein [Gemmatimonadaceae bacterium]